MLPDPRIGILSNGKFYCFPNGYGQPEFVGTQEEVEEVLGLRPAPAPSQVKATEVHPLRDYLVTVTPRIVTYAGNSTFGEYTVVRSARSRAEAIKLARQERLDAEGQYGVPATYRARLLGS